MTPVLKLEKPVDIDALAARLAREDAAILVAENLAPGEEAALREKLRALGVNWTRIVVLDEERDPKAAGKTLKELVEIWSQALAAAGPPPPVTVNRSKKLSRRALIHVGAAAALEYTALPTVSAECASTPTCMICVEACPQGALKGKPPKPDATACLECGLCSSLCPQDFISFQAFPTEMLKTLIDAAAGHGIHTVTLTCPLSRDTAYSGNPGLIVVAPCTAAAHPALYLYAKSRGVELRDHCDREDCPLAEARRIHVEAVEKILSALEPPHVWPGSPRKYLLQSSPLREGWDELPAPLFFRLRASQKCTLCGACTAACKFQALRLEEGETYRLLFRHGDCVGCGACVSACPEDALSLEWALNPSELRSEEAIAESPAAHCVSCGKIIGPEAEIRRLEEKLGKLPYLRLCGECRRAGHGTEGLDVARFLC